MHRVEEGQSDWEKSEDSSDAVRLTNLILESCQDKVGTRLGRDFEVENADGNRCQSRTVN